MEEEEEGRDHALIHIYDPIYAPTTHMGGEERGNAVSPTICRGCLVVYFEGVGEKRRTKVCFTISGETERQITPLSAV